MRKAILLLLLIYLCYTGQAQITKDTDQYNRGYSNYASGQFNNDTLVLIEKVYIHTDRIIYFPGDDIWYKAYLIDATERLLSDHSNNLHVELISPSSKIIDSRITRLEGGLGNGDFQLPADIKSGRYKLRAYTNYMRNFSDSLFYSKEVVVINSSDSTDETSDEVKYVENRIQISFFPEGGSLVDNVISTVAFKATNSLGKGCDISGKIYSSNGDLITTFRSAHHGMGSFLLRPSPGLSYYSIFKGDDSIDVRTELPKSFSDGVAFSVSINQNSELLITTKSNPQTFQLVSEHDLLLRFSQRKEVIKTVICKVKGPVTDFLIPTGDLPDGILMLTLSTLDDTPLAERLIYIQKVTTVSLQIETDKLLYNKREQVSLKLSMQGDSNILGTANISLACANKNLNESTSQFPRNISSWFLLESDVQGPVEDPSYYFDPLNSNRFRDLDLLLLIQGWRDFAWKYDKAYFPPEKGFTISGSLTKSSGNKPIENSRVSIGIFGSRGSFLETVPVDSTGRFSTSGIDFTGEARLIVTGIGKKDRLQGELHLDSVFYEPAKVSDSLSLVSIIVEIKWSYLKTYYEINESLRKKYKLSDTISIGEVSIIAERHKDPQTVKVESSRAKYGIPDTELKITEQMQGFSSLLDILRAGTIPGVVVSLDNTIYIRGNSSIIAINPPLLLIDGIPIFPGDTSNQLAMNELMTLSISIVDRIDVLKSVFATNMYGILGANGVINVITKAGGTGNYNPPEYTSKTRISGYDAPRIFYSPQHLQDSETDYKPDLRNTLLWEPDINLEINKKAIINYYNGDNSSVIKIIVEGITSTGIPITGKTEYEVR